MSLFARFKLGALAAKAAAVARDVLAKIGPAGILSLVMKIVEIERERRGTPGTLKADELARWFASEFPQYATAVGMVRAFANSFVSLANALGWFAKRGA